MSRSAALGPVERAPHRLAQVRGRRAGRRALIQAHGDVGAEVFLNRYRPFRTQLKQLAINVRAEDRGPVVDAPTQSKAVDLKAAAVGENRAIPAHEPVQAA